MAHTDFLTGVRIHDGEDVIALFLQPGVNAVFDATVNSPAHVFDVASLPLGGSYDQTLVLDDLTADDKLALGMSLAGIGADTLDELLDPDNTLAPAGLRARRRGKLHLALLKQSSFELLTQVGAAGSEKERETVQEALNFYDNAVMQVKARRDGDPMKAYFEGCLRLEGDTFYCLDRSNPRSAVQTPIPFWFFNRRMSMQRFADWDRQASIAAMHADADSRRVLFQGLQDLQYLFYGLLTLCRQFTPSMHIGDEPNDGAVKALAQLMAVQAA